MKRLFLSVLLMFIAVDAQGAHYHLSNMFSLVNDTDHEKQMVTGIGVNAYFDKKKGNKLILLAGTRSFKSNDGSESFNRVSLEGSKTVGQRFRVDLRTVFYESDNWSPFTYGGTLVFDPSSKVHLELYGDKEIVDSLRAVRSRYYINIYGISADYSLTPEMTIVGAYSGQHITDGNNRDVQIARIIYAPKQSDWLLLSAYGKHLRSDFPGKGYFSPKKLWEYMGIAQATRAFFEGKFLLRLKGGIGQRFIHNEKAKIISLVELKAKGWFTERIGAEGTVGFSNDSGKLGGGESYSRYYAILSLLYALE